MKYKINYITGGAPSLSAAEQDNGPAAEPERFIFNNDNLREAVDLWCSGNENEATRLYGHISTWDVSQVTDMSKLFEYKRDFNADIRSWDVSSVNNMSSMFHGAFSFNQPLYLWSVHSVTDMSNMFNYAILFNQSLDIWDVSSVTNMESMFYGASSFNQPLDLWNVSSVIEMQYMFSRATLFNQPLYLWDVSSVTNMEEMFSGASSFNQDIGLWIISDDCDVTHMFLMSGVTRKTFLSNVDGGTGRGIYGNKIANYFDLNYFDLPNPKTNDELVKFRNELIEIKTRWERRGPLVMSLKASENDPNLSGIGKNIQNIPKGLQDEMTMYLGGANN